MPDLRCCVILLLLPLLTLCVSCDWQSDSDWVRHGGSCYKWVEAPDYWYTAEQRCRAYAAGGHLVSIGDEQENTLVGRLTYCLPAWTGRYGVSADRLGDPANYRWTDGSGGGFQRHNFSRISTPHQPLVTAEGLQWFNNLYHARNGFVCEAAASPPADNRTGEAAGCPSGGGWRRLGNFCYLQPDFQATYIEAGYYCDGVQAQLVSVHSERELRLLSLLNLGRATCPVELWVGLVKLNPCRMEFSTGQTICYRWADRSGNYSGFPAWAAGHPNGDLVTNCVVLSDRNMRSEPCHARRAFVCKRPALEEPGTTTTARYTQSTVNTDRTQRPTQPPTQQPTQRPTQPPTQPPTQWPTQPPTQPPTSLPPSIVAAAYDFRRGLGNLARPGRFRVLDVGHAALVNGYGAVLNGSRGIRLDTESGALTRQLKRGKDWTLFYFAERTSGFDQLLVDVSGDKAEPSLTLMENRDTTDLSLYGSAGYFRDESDLRKGAADQQRWLRGAVVFSGSRAYFYRNGIDASTDSASTSSHRYDDNVSHMMLGNAYHSVLPGYKGVLACFGVAHVALSTDELAEAFQSYCP